METTEYNNKRLKEVHILSADAVAVEETINQCMTRLSYMTAQGVVEMTNETEEMFRINRIMSEVKLIESLTWELHTGLKKLTTGIEAMQEKSPSDTSTQAQSAEAD